MRVWETSKYINKNTKVFYTKQKNKAKICNKNVKKGEGKDGEETKI